MIPGGKTKEKLFNPGMFHVASRRQVIVSNCSEESANLCSFWYAATGRDVMRRGADPEETERYKRVLYNTLVDNVENPESVFYDHMREEGIDMTPEEIISTAHEVMSLYRNTPDNCFVKSWEVNDALKHKDIDNELDANAVASGLY